jgi:hypothetical protein
MTTPVQRRIRQALSDTFTFVKSREVNLALSAVTLEQLVAEQIGRNGETALSNASQFNPYAFTPGQTRPASQQPITQANYVSGTDASRPTKLDQIIAIQNELSALIEEIKALPPDEVNAPGVDEDTSEDALLSSDTLLTGGV